MFDWSFDLLPADLQNRFCQLAVLSGGFSTEAAETACGVDNIQLDLMALVDHSLLEQQTDVDGEPCFKMLGFTREYAFERLSTVLV
jgi:predicted ATPase